MYRAMSFPEDPFGGAQTNRCPSAIDHVRIPHHHLRKWHSELVSCVASEMLIGKKKNFWGFRVGPFECSACIRGGANQPAAFAYEGFNGRGGVHVCQRSNAAAVPPNHSESLQLLPAVFYLADFSHVSHRAPCIEVRQNHLLIRSREDICAFRHEMHAAKDDVTSIRLRGNLGKLVRIPSVIGKADHFIALIVVSKNEAVATELATSLGDAVIHRMIGEDEIIIQRA